MIYPFLIGTNPRINSFSHRIIETGCFLVLTEFLRLWLMVVISIGNHMDLRAIKEKLYE